MGRSVVGLLVRGRGAVVQRRPKIGRVQVVAVAAGVVAPPDPVLAHAERVSFGDDVVDARGGGLRDGESLIVGVVFVEAQARLLELRRQGAFLGGVGDDGALVGATNEQGDDGEHVCSGVGDRNVVTKYCHKTAVPSTFLLFWYEFKTQNIPLRR